MELVLFTSNQQSRSKVIICEVKYLNFKKRDLLWNVEHAEKKPIHDQGLNLEVDV